MKLSMKSKYLASSILALSIAVIVGCSEGQPKISATLNQNASLTGQLPANPLRWRVITAEINQVDSTMSTLYGNDLAVQSARTHLEHSYPAGAVLALVTWTQRADERYFGARIPDQVKCVEFVFVEAGADGYPSYSYQKFEGKPLQKLAALQNQATSDRTAYLLSQRAAVMP